MSPPNAVPTTGNRVCPNGGRWLVLGQLVSSGGAGSVYLLPEDPAQVAKIYHTDSTPLKQYARKIAAMLQSAPNLPVCEYEGVRIIQIAWPTAALTDARGNFCGFLMPLLDIRATIELEYMMQERQARAEGLPVNLGSRLTLAANVCAVVAALHAQRHYVVDLKPVNIRFYRRSFHLAMLDCDGFSINGGGERLPAQQFTAEYLAPEFHNGKPLTGAEEEQDCFALAVIIFPLLNFGIHPYSGRPVRQTGTAAHQPQQTSMVTTASRSTRRALSR